MSTQLTEPPVSLSNPSGPSEPEPTEGKGSILRKLVIVLVILAAVGGAVWKIRSNQATQAATPTRGGGGAGAGPQPVLITPVEQKTMPIYLEALGTVTPYNSVTVKSRVDGQLMSVNVREGQSVHKGQLLAEIDPRPYEAALAQAQGQLVKDQANAKNAEAEAQRYAALLDAGVVSKESQQLQESTAGQAQGAIAADQAAIQAVKVNLAYTKITSPIDGVVGLRQVDPGNIVHASDSTGLLLVTQMQPTAVIFTLPEDQLPQVLQKVRTGVKLPVEAWDRSETTHLGDGAVLTADNQIDPTTGTDKIKAVFANKDKSLFPNQFVNVRLVLEQRRNAIVVPAAAIQTGSNGSFVFVVKKGTPPAGSAAATTRGRGQGGGGRQRAAAGGGAQAGGARAGGGAAGGGRGGNGGSYYVVAQPVKVDLTEGAQVILASGVNPGDQVVIDGTEKLLDGSRVTPRTESQLPGANTKTNWGQADTPATPFSSGNATATTIPARGTRAGQGANPAAGGRHQRGGQQPAQPAQ